ncbi:unnamed protein product [Ranitomeya imitator]|uniref:AP complex mu/sigma subunit domain-containing protein n=1 Tax=Ranitomeya imitator TaxID=111125 RepID=A0ABN9LGE9_9NEOB|nr:unnamed protein product [Ranitomeya imitator]
MKISSLSSGDAVIFHLLFNLPPREGFVQCDAQETGIPSTGPIGRQGKLRLQKWYITLTEKVKRKITQKLMHIILTQSPKTSSFVDWKDLKLVYKSYASLYFCCAIEEDHELLTLEIIHRLVELLDKYFGNVCELDIIFNFQKAYFILDEFLLGSEIQKTPKESVVRAIVDSDMLQETMEEYMNKPTF